MTNTIVIYFCFQRFKDFIHQYAEYKGNYKYLELFKSLYEYFFWDRNPKPINSRIMNVSLGRCLARKRKLKDTSNIKSILRLSHFISKSVWKQVSGYQLMFVTDICLDNCQPQTKLLRGGMTIAVSQFKSFHLISIYFKTCLVMSRHIRI